MDTCLITCLDTYLIAGLVTGLDTCLITCLDTYLIAGLVTGLDTCLVAEPVEATFPVDE